MLELLTGLSGSDEERNDLTVRLGISELLDKPSEAVKTIFGNDMIVDVIANAVSFPCLHCFMSVP